MMSFVVFNRSKNQANSQITQSKSIMMRRRRRRIFSALFLPRRTCLSTRLITKHEVSFLCNDLSISFRTVQSVFVCGESHARLRSKCALSVYDRQSLSICEMQSIKSQVIPQRGYNGQIYLPLFLHFLVLLVSVLLLLWHAVSFIFIITDHLQRTTRVLTVSLLAHKYNVYLIAQTHTHGVHSVLGVVKLEITDSFFQIWN